MNSVLKIVFTTLLGVSCVATPSNNSVDEPSRALSTTDSYPNAPITYIVPFAPGGESDITARFQQIAFRAKFGQDLIVSYKAGGGGAVGWSQLNSLPGDGHTIMGINLPHIIIQPLQGNIGYTADDIIPVHFFHYTPDALIVHQNSEILSLEEFVKHAKSIPGAVTLSGSGKGSANHIAKIRFDTLADIETTYVPFRGTGAAITAVLGKQVTAQWGYSSAGAAYGDQIRLLAIAMETRHPRFPNVPTFRELGYDLVSGAYRGIAVPNSTSEGLRQRLSTLMSEINKDAIFIDKMKEGGFALIDVTYDQMDNFMAQKKREYKTAANSTGLAP
jgi:tripartite-type tricarboxylate transporter receptor subunit TctC